MTGPKQRVQVMGIEVEFLADHPDLTSILAAWFFDQWGQNNPNLSPEILEAAVKERLNRDFPPLCLVAFHRQKPVATAALKVREMETHPQFEHWLGNVYVLTDYRRQGIATLLIRRLLRQAKQIGIRNLYLYTRGQEELYEKLGWQTIEQLIYHGRQAKIMQQTLR